MSPLAMNDQEFFDFMMQKRTYFKFREDREFTIHAQNPYDVKCALRVHEYVVYPKFQLQIQYSVDHLVDLYDDGTEIKVPNDGKYYTTRMLIFQIDKGFAVSCKFILEERSFWDGRVIIPLDEYQIDKLYFSEVFSGIPVNNEYTNA